MIYTSSGEKYSVSKSLVLWLPGQEFELRMKAGLCLDIASFRQDVHVVLQLLTHLECQFECCAGSETHIHIQ